MFVFMAITGYICSSGLYSTIFRPVLWIMRHIIKADDRILSVFLLSLIGGYPIGMKLLKEIIAQNKNYPAIKDACMNSSVFCYCISPTFALIMLGNGVFGSTSAGVVIYLSNVLACLLTGIVVSRACVLRTGSVSREDQGSLIGAVNSASRAMFTVCTVIIAFNTVISCIRAFLLNFGAVVPEQITGILEISNLMSLSSADISMIPFVSAVASMGGICVMLQCTAIAGGAFPVKRFIAARLPCALLSAVIAQIILQFTDISVSASTYSPEYTYEFSANRIIVLVLIAMCIIIFHKSDKIFKKV